MHTCITVMIALVLLGLSSVTLLSQENRHLGKWQGSIDGEIGALQFNEDGSLRVFQNGKELTVELEDSMTVRYEIDYSHKPILLDIVFQLVDGTEFLRGLAIIRFKGEEMWMKVGDKAEQRPLDFGEEEEKTTTMRFRRVAELDFDGLE